MFDAWGRELHGGLPVAAASCTVAGKGFWEGSVPRRWHHLLVCSRSGVAAFGCGLFVALLAASGSARQSQTMPGAAAAGDGEACTVAPAPNSLWSLAQCCSRHLYSNPGCRAYNAADEYIILKDNSPAKPAAYLIIPTKQIAGIEDKQIFLRPVADFWEYAWQYAQLVLKKPAGAIGLAINSVHGRTQNQLHIHIACILPSVAHVLEMHAQEVAVQPATPARLALGPARHIYRVVKAVGLAGGDSPFNLVAAMPGAKADMGDQSIAVVGADTPGMFYILDTVAEGTNPGSAEELLDQTCGG